MRFHAGTERETLERAMREIRQLGQEAAVPDENNKNGPKTWRLVDGQLGVPGQPLVHCSRGLGWRENPA